MRIARTVARASVNLQVFVAGKIDIHRIALIAAVKSNGHIVTCVTARVADIVTRTARLLKLAWM
jgi:hypothetical protein